MYTVAHISDPHLDGGESSLARLRQVAAYLRAMDPTPDVIALTGDIIQGDADGGYAVARDLLADIAPLLSCPGNSDKRPLLREIVPHDGAETDGNDPVNYVQAVGAVTFVMLDSSVPGEFIGELTVDTLDWLRQALGTIPPATPIVVCLHQPPVSIGIPAVDAFGLQNPEDLAAALQAHDNVVAVLVGHTHGATVTTFAGVPVIVAPGIHSGLRAPWEGGDSLLDEDVPPAIALHLIDVDAAPPRLVTHIRSISSVAGGV